MAVAGFSVTAKVEFAKVPNRQAFWKEIDKEMRVQGQEDKKLYRAWTDSWASKPRYKVKIKKDIRRGLITGIVTPTADEGLLRIMMWLNEGTGSYTGRGYYPIRPIGEGYPLRYQKTYTPSTQPGIIYSRKSSYSGPMVTRNEVWHPGIKPRNIIAFIIERRAAAYMNAMGEATKRGEIAAVKAGRKP